jgi:hypothetical protein
MLKLNLALIQALTVIYFISANLILFLILFAFNIK